MSNIVLAFAECANSAQQLAQHLGIAVDTVMVRNFPDGESLVRVPASASTVILYRSLDNPNAKLVEMLLAAAAARDGGAQRIFLVAPYLAYMRQDMAFSPGEAVSQRVIGQLLADHFDGVLTIDPHLHRISDLREVMPGIPAISLSAAPLLAQHIHTPENPVLIGPDSESEQWAASIADLLGLDLLLGQKQRKGDRDVAMTIRDIHTVRGRPAVLVDDVISSGMTLISAARLLRGAGASRVDAVATHCLASVEDLARMQSAGIATIRSTDTIAGTTAKIAIAPLVAKAICELQWMTTR